MELHRNETVSVGVDPVVLSEEKQGSTTRRINISVINTSAGGQVISLAIDGTAVAGSGIRLNPGGSWTDTASGDYLPSQKIITAIADLAGGTVALQERAGDLR